MLLLPRRVLPQLLFLCGVLALNPTLPDNNLDQQYLNTHWPTALVALALCQLANYVRARSLYSRTSSKVGGSFQMTSAASGIKHE